MISILTVNYFTSDELHGLAQSLVEYPPSCEWELVVTNNSPADAVRLPATVQARATVTALNNRGYAAGINHAFQRSRGEYVFIVNPDVRVTAGAVDAAIAYLQASEDVGIVLPRLRYANGAVQPSARRFYTWPVVLFARSPLRWMGWRPGFFRRYLCEEIDGTGPTEVDWGLGGAMFLRRRDCDDPPGVFDERFFLYFEDVDLCLRTWRRGRRVVFHPGIECIHAHRRSSRNPVTLAGWRHFRSLGRFIVKHRGLPQRPSAGAEPGRGENPFKPM